eukprot:6201064-Pleurochrysis_carterae.AAC.1
MQATHSFNRIDAQHRMMMEGAAVHRTGAGAAGAAGGGRCSRTRTVQAWPLGPSCTPDAAASYLSCSPDSVDSEQLEGARESASRSKASAATASSVGSTMGVCAKLERNTAERVVRSALARGGLSRAVAELAAAAFEAKLPQ